VRNCLKGKKKSRSPRTSSFNRALTAAQHQLERFEKERAEAQAKVAKLNAEIPALQQTIRALQQQLNPATSLHAVPNLTSAPTPSSRPVPDSLRPYVLPTDLTGMGSVPNTQAVAAEEPVPDLEADPNALLNDDLGTDVVVPEDEP